ncbi:MAG: Tfp pilus assembly protein FimT/FimU [Alphaproteobacteria bacterium]
MKNQAFSLIEISVVILVIGILIAGVSSGIDLYDDMNITRAKSLTQNSRVGRIPDLLVWLESVSDKSFSKSEAKDGQSLNSWQDINPQVINKATITTSGTKPVYQQKGINNLPVVKFSGNGCFIINYNNFSGEKTKTIFAVLYETQKNSASGSYLFDNQSVPPQFAFALSTDFKGQMYAGAFLTNLTISLKKPYILTLVYNENNSFFRVNASASPTGNIGTNQMNNSISLGGSLCTANTDELFGQIGEFIVYDRVLRESEYLDVEAYLAKKWMIKF